jgi:hypothetical protein
MFTYTVSDPRGDTANGTVNVTLDPNLAKNDNLSLAGAVGPRNIVDDGNGNLSVSVTGNNDTVLLAGGNNNVSPTGNNTAVIGNDNDSISLSGDNGILVLGNGKDNVMVSGTSTSESVTAGTWSDNFLLGRISRPELILHGLHDTVSVDGGMADITDKPGGLDQLILEVGALGGTVSLSDFSSGSGVLVPAQALARSENWTSPGQIAAALVTDGHGGSLLALTGGYGSIDFQNVLPSHLTSNNFQIR